MNRFKKLTIVASGALASLLTGCAVTGPAVSSSGFSVRHFPGGDRSVFRRSAQEALIELGYRITDSDETDSLVAAAAVDPGYTSPVKTGLSGLRTGTETRRLARIRFRQNGDVIDVFAKVVIEEQVTEAHRMFALDEGGLDNPGITPIQREAATTSEQNTVWRTIRRDRKAERELLSLIRKRTGTSESEPEVPPPTPE